jgi:hypothetical protein
MMGCDEIHAPWILFFKNDNELERAKIQGTTDLMEVLLLHYLMYELETC